MQVSHSFHFYMGIFKQPNSASLMITFVELIRTKYGGARQWFIQCSGLSDEELDLIRAYLIEETS